MTPVSPPIFVSRRPDSIALDATLRAAAPHQLSRSGDVALKIETADIREKIRERKCGNTILFVVDASGVWGRSSGCLR